MFESNKKAMTRNWFNQNPNLTGISLLSIFFSVMLYLMIGLQNVFEVDIKVANILSRLVTD